MSSTRFCSVSLRSSSSPGCPEGKVRRLLTWTPTTWPESIRPSCGETSCASVATLGAVALVPQAAHQLGTGSGDSRDVPARLVGRAGEPATGDGRGDEAGEGCPEGGGGTPRTGGGRGGRGGEGARGVAAVGGGVCERAADLEELDDRAGPAVG